MAEKNGAKEKCFRKAIRDFADDLGWKNEHSANEYRSAYKKIINTVVKLKIFK